jgi:hypothetical protein
MFQIRFVPFASSWLCAAAIAACGSDTNVLGTLGPDSGGMASGSTAGQASGGSSGSSGTSGAGIASGASTSGTPTSGSTSGSANAGSGSSAGASSGLGTTCTSDSECSEPEFHCSFPVDGGCSALGSCTPYLGVGPACPSTSPSWFACGCDGTEVYLGCGQAPLTSAPTRVLHQGSCADGGSQSGSTSGASGDADSSGPISPLCVGKACGAGCGSGEFPSFCDSAGRCVVAVIPTCT